MGISFDLSVLRQEMRRQTACGLCGGLMLLSACVGGKAAGQNTTPPPVATNFAPDFQQSGDACDAKQLEPLTGKPFVALAEHPAKGGLRVLYPLQPITMDFNPSRLNARVDQSGRIISLFCG